MFRAARGRSRPRLTSRAAILAAVICAVTLTLAYPVREYISQRRQLSQLSAQQAALSVRLKQLQAEHRKLNDPAYIEQMARDQLHMCLPRQNCYVIIDGQTAATSSQAKASASTPWYGRLWQSVQQADSETSPTPASTQKATTPKTNSPKTSTPKTSTGGHAKASR